LIGRDSLLSVRTRFRKGTIDMGAECVPDTFMSGLRRRMKRIEYDLLVMPMSSEFDFWDHGESNDPPTN